MIVKLVIEVFSSSIDAKTTYSIVFMLIMLLKVSENIKYVKFDTKHINIDRLIKSHKNVTKYLILSLNTKNWTRSLHIKFRECLSKITKLLCDSTFCLITMHVRKNSWLQWIWSNSFFLTFWQIDARFAFSDVLIEHITRSKCLCWSWFLTRLTTSRDYRR
jgi:hypothetical protein